MIRLEWRMNKNASTKASDFAYDFVESWNRGTWGNNTNWRKYLVEDIDNSLIYYEDKWEILEEYCTPYDADWDYAYECFFNEVCACIHEEEYEEEED